jgi:hypothetical protein
VALRPCAQRRQGDTRMWGAQRARRIQSHEDRGGASWATAAELVRRPFGMRRQLSPRASRARARASTAIVTLEFVCVCVLLLWSWLLLFLMSRRRRLRWRVWPAKSRAVLVRCALVATQQRPRPSSRTSSPPRSDTKTSAVRPPPVGRRRARAPAERRQREAKWSEWSERVRSPAPSCASPRTRAVSSTVRQAPPPSHPPPIHLNSAGGAIAAPPPPASQPANAHRCEGARGGS